MKHDTVFWKPYKILEINHRNVLVGLWIMLLAASLYGYFFQREALHQALTRLTQSPPLWAYGLYLVLGCLRGFTLIPATYLLVAGMLFLSPVPLFLLTLVGIVVSSTAVYYFAGAMQFDRFFERRYAPQVARLRRLLARHELPIVISWSFFPFAPTDAVCYVCGALRVDLKKCLLGVTVGEGAICAVYIFAGRQALAWLR